jgi:putative ABC transport system permease protein
MDHLSHDVRVALRGLRRAPAFTVTAVLILGLGIGMAVAMFAVCSAVLLRRLPVPDQDRVVTLQALDRAGTDVWFSEDQVDALRRDARTLRDVAGIAHFGSVVVPLEDNGRPSLLAQARVTGRFFEVLGARPILGRMLVPDDDIVGAAHVIVISYGAWQRHFGSDPAILSRRLVDPLRRWTFAIVGVAPPGLDYPNGVDYWTPDRPMEADGIDVFARLAPGATASTAGSEFRSLLARLPRADVRGEIAEVRVETLERAVVGNIQPVLVALTSAVGLLLLIVCVNVGNLLLLRVNNRNREFALRKALGASFAAVVRSVLAEAAILGAAGGALGYALAVILRHVLLAAAPRELPRIDVVQASGLPIAGAVVITTAVITLFGLAPALLAAARGAAGSLQLGVRSGRDSKRRRGLRQALVASQVALAVMLLGGAGLLVRSLAQLEGVKLGYVPEHLSVVQLSLPMAKYDSLPQLFAVYGALAPQLSSIPGVTAVTPINLAPFFAPTAFMAAFDLEGSLMSHDSTGDVIPIEPGGPEYFRTFGIPILRGRGFLATDGEHAPPVVVISEAATRRVWPGVDMLGKRIRFHGDTLWHTVVGIAGDVRLRSLRDAPPTVFLPYEQFGWQGALALRTTVSLSAILPSIERVVKTVDPEWGVWQTATMDQLLAGPLAEPKLITTLLSGFALVALLLAAIGLYGVMASAVREETHDIGVRMALGATPRLMRHHVLHRALAVVSVGLAVGLLGELFASRLVQSLLFNVQPTDPVAVLGVCGTIFVVALVAAYLPARRASAVDPAQTLRSV